MTTVPILLGFNGSNYQVTRSLRFRSSASAYLNRTPSVAGSQTTWTWSGWVKRGSLTSGGNFTIFSAGVSAQPYALISFSSDQLAFDCINSGSVVVGRRYTSAVYRDPSAWYHIVAVWDTTNTTAASRMRLYVNGVQVTAFSLSSDPALNATTQVNTTAAHYFGEYPGGGNYFDGYMAEVNFIDGQALTPSSFGYFDLYGVWQPKKYNGTFGTNGFYLPFSNTTSTTTLVADSSGNGNNWTANNISLTAGTTYDSMIDSPTNYADGGTGRGNYAVLNPINQSSYVTLSNANLTVTGNTSTNSGVALSTIGMLSGKWYWETTITTVGGFSYAGMGISPPQNNAETYFINSATTGGCGWRNDGSGGGYGSTGATYSTFTTNDIIGVAVDFDNGALYFSKNGTWINGGVPTSGASRTGATNTWTVGAITGFPAGAGYNSSVNNLNCGQRPFTYTPPSGYLALNTQNLPPSAVPYGAPYMNAITYTGYGPLVPSGLGILTKRNASTQSVSKSLRFRASASAYLNRTPASTTNRRTYTISRWGKRGVLGSPQYIISAFNAGTNECAIRFNANDTLEIEQYTSPSYNYQLVTTQVFRDPSAWFHIVVAVDTTQATASDRIKLYVNGVQVTSFSTASYPSLNYDTNFNFASYTNQIGAWNTNYFHDGYMAEFNFIDGQALTPSSFGQTNSDGIWVPKAYTGTYGTNGFYLPFTNTTSTTTLGNDSSGNGNNFTVNNISLTAGTTYDSMIDSPTDYASAGDYAVLNPLDKGAGITLSNANLTAYSNALNYITRSTIAVSSGKWYWEAVQTAQGSAATNNMINGIIPPTESTANNLGYTAGSYGYVDTGNKVNNSVVTAYGATYGLNDIIGVALDLDNGTLTFYKNGVSQGVAFTGISGTFLFAIGDRGGGVSKEPTWAINFGQRPFTYSAPSGYSTLNTYNITAPSTTWFSSANNSGNASATAYPDFVWIKARSSAQNHSLNDTLRGPTLNLLSNSTAAEAGASTMFAVNKYGLTLGNDASVNSSSYTDVMWGWQGGNGTTSTNTSGTITSTVSASTTSGVSIVTYTGTGANATVGHGLGVAPSFIIVRSRNNGGATNWAVWHTSFSSTEYIFLNSTAAKSSSGGAALWNSTLPSSTVFSIGTDTNTNYNTTNMLAYCFAAIRGFSAFGSYTGNGSTDGPFVYTGFKPRWIIMKCSTTAGLDWNIVDTSRNLYNVTTSRLWADLSNAEDSTDNVCDILSNGFKLRSTNTNTNASGATFIYAAFAENPFNMSRAR